MDGPDRFSVVVPALDREATIERTVASICRSADASGRPTEIVVVDDGSTDRTAAISSSLASADPRVIVVRQANAGVAAARNAGAAAATGRWLTFLDCDDEVEPGWLAELGDLLAAGARLAFTPGHAIRPDGAERVWRVLPLGPVFADVAGLFNPGMFALARTDFVAVGGYATALTFSENTELGIRLTQHLEGAEAIPTAAASRPLMTIHIAENGRSNADSPSARLRSALYLLDVHRDRLHRDPRLHATYWSIAGVAAARLGRAPLARRCLAAAARTHPSPKNLARAATVQVAPLRRRTWPPAPGRAPS